MKINLKPAKINAKIKTPKVSIKIDTQKIYPELENLEIIPTTEEQNFKPTKYGFNEVKVNAIPDDYVVPKVVEKTLVLSRVNIEEGGLIL